MTPQQKTMLRLALRILGKSTRMKPYCENPDAARNELFGVWSALLWMDMLPFKSEFYERFEEISDAMDNLWRNDRLLK